MNKKHFFPKPSTFVKVQFLTAKKALRKSNFQKNSAKTAIHLLGDRNDGGGRLPLHNSWLHILTCPYLIVRAFQLSCVLSGTGNIKICSLAALRSTSSGSNFRRYTTYSLIQFLLAPTLTFCSVTKLGTWSLDVCFN